MSIAIIEFPQRIFLNSMDSCDETLSEAIYTIFKSEVEQYFHLDFGGIVIPIAWGFTLSGMIADTFRLLRCLQANENDTIRWGESCFMSEWQIEFKGQKLLIRAGWTDCAGHEVLARLRDQNQPVVFDKDRFLNAWLDLVEIVRKCITLVGYRIEDLSDCPNEWANGVAWPDFPRLDPAGAVELIAEGRQESMTIYSK